jgi:hypothetical protein
MNDAGDIRIGMHHFVKESGIAVPPEQNLLLKSVLAHLKTLTPPREKAPVIESPGSKRIVESTGKLGQ